MEADLRFPVGKFQRPTAPLTDAQRGEGIEAIAAPPARLTEELPLIKTYNEAKWAELGDVRTAPIEPSLALLENLHKRWVLLLRTLGPAEWSRQFRHPEWEKPMSLDDSLALYAWHGKHHVAHITSLREREGWQ